MCERLIPQCLSRARTHTQREREMVGKRSLSRSLCGLRNLYI